jgi:FkbM family methyltransferase
VAREATHAAPATYRIPKAGGARVVLRHASFDAFTLDEVFGQTIYEPPPPVRSALAALGRPLRVLDLGANIGLFALYACSLFRVKHLTAFEPDPESRRVLEATAAANGADRETRDAAAANRTGRAAFRADGTVNAGLSDVTGDDRIDVPTEDVLPIMRDHDHPELCPEADARVAAIACLTAAGYRFEEVPTPAPAGYGSLWAWRE